MWFSTKYTPTGKGKNGAKSKYPRSKGHVLLKAAKIEASIYFIRMDIARAYAPSARRDTTFWFGKEGDAILSMKSYVVSQKG
jgi:hypothetical protein